MKVLIDQAKCCGAGQCVLVASAVFDQREEDGVVFLLNPEPPPEQFEAVRQAQRICPALAIEVQD
ncbi:ferredoxin [Bradyrhizobium sp. dw_78]|uniref:ferredoxin n=1 Tax=Bradyrhizobium sp. dw_78 TaxID=2719793 RepID=UPI001BD48D8D|nr:ferredoxin [Bradyrhizobium sp. dw_78]